MPLTGVRPGAKVMAQRKAIMVHVTASMERMTKSVGGWEPALSSKASLLKNIGPPRGKLKISSGERETGFVSAQVLWVFTRPLCDGE